MGDPGPEPLIESFSERRGARGASAWQPETRRALNRLIRHLTLCCAITNRPVHISCPTHLLILRPGCCGCLPCCSASHRSLCIHRPPPPRRLPAGSVYLWFPVGLLLISPCSCFGCLKKKLCSQRWVETESGARVNSAFALALNKTFELSACSCLAESQ